MCKDFTIIHDARNISYNSTVTMKDMVVCSHSSSGPQPLKPIRVFVADRNRMASQLLSESLARDSRFEITGVVAAAEILSMAGSIKADVAVVSLDCDSSSKKGLQVARTLGARCPDLRIVILLETGGPDSAVAAFRCGATGVFCRTEPLSELRACIERASRGEIWASSSHSQLLLQALRSTPSCEGIEQGKIGLLTHRELQVAEQAAQGQSNKQIADRLGLSEHTIKNYLFRIFDKLGVSNRFELLFLLFKECNRPGAEIEAAIKSDGGEPIEAYLKAAEQGVVAAQFIVGMAHLEGYGVEKNNYSAYYWLRMAEENSGTIGHRSRALVEELRSAVKTEDFEAVEHKIAIMIQENKFLRSRRSAEFIRPNTDLPPLRMLREISASAKSKAAS
jgi:two-component system, NarL family, nitrate/nitrite response regulator NarL